MLVRHKGKLTNRSHEYANGSTPTSPYSPDSPIPSSAKYDPTAHSRPSPYTRDVLLDAYIHAGLDSISSSLITIEQTCLALGGAKVRPTAEQKRKTLSQSSQGERITRKRHYA